MHYLCEKYYKPITVQYYVADCVSGVLRLTWLDLEMCSWNGTWSYVGGLLYYLLSSSSSTHKHILGLNFSELPG